MSLLQPAPQPADRGITLRVPANRPVHLTVFGTSLSHNELWTTQLAEAMRRCLGRPVDLSVVARPGAAVDWALDQVGAVAATRPDVVLIEFAINDADLRDGLALREAHQLHDRLIADLRDGVPEAGLVLMTMSPAQGLRGLIRLRLGAHYQQYRTLAEAQNVGLLDLYPRWLARPRAERGLQADGLHPDPDVAAEVIVPVLTAYLGRSLGKEGCA